MTTGMICSSAAVLALIAGAILAVVGICGLVTALRDIGDMIDRGDW